MQIFLCCVWFNSSKLPMHFFITGRKSDILRHRCLLCVPAVLFVGASAVTLRTFSLHLSMHIFLFTPFCAAVVRVRCLLPMTGKLAIMYFCLRV